MARGLPNLKDHKGKFVFTANLSDPSIYGTIEKFLIWCKRESMTFEQGLLTVISEGVTRHYDGNFQTLLGSYNPDGIKSEGQQEQLIIRYFEERHEKHYPIRYLEIGAKIREDLGFSGSKLVAAIERVVEVLLGQGMEVVSRQ